MLNHILRNRAQLYLKRGNHTLLRRFYTLNFQRNTSSLVKDNVKIPKYRLLHTDNHEKDMFRLRTERYLLVTLGLLGISLIFASIYDEERKMRETKETKGVFNQQDHRNIAKLIGDRDKPAESYYLLIGPQGTGKTVLTTLAAAKYAKKGVMYVESSNKSSFIKNLYQEMKKLNYMDYLWTTYFPYGYKDDWKKVFHKFEKNAEKKRRNEHYTPLLIIDNVKISDGDYAYRRMLRNIQLSAKAATEHGNYNVMFVTNDQKTLEFFLGKNFFFNLILFQNFFISICIAFTDDIAESHMEIIYLGDLNKDLALSYLRKHKINDDTAEKIYEVVGGRIIDLSHVIKHFERNKVNFLNGIY
jgi:hypothetical protein